MSAEASLEPKRVAGVDVARGLAVLAMLQTHAYDGWRDDARTSVGFAVTRVLATLASPSFTHALSLPTATLGLALLATACLAASTVATARSSSLRRSRGLRHVRIDTRAR
jgi:uncharacterized membrane protein